MSHPPVAAGLTRRQWGQAAASAILAGPTGARAAADPEAGFPITAAQLPFGSHSHWLQPWRSLITVRSARHVTSGIGVVLNDNDASPAALAMLFRNGIRHMRTEIGWGEVRYDETGLTQAARIEARLARIHDAGLRPLILLNANHGMPTPNRLSTFHMAEAAAAGARTLRIVPSGALQTLEPARSGLNGFGPMASVLITAIDGAELTLSRPLPKELPAGAPLQIATLRYEPFSFPGSARNAATISGWLRYVDLVAEAATRAMRTGGTADLGFDLEIWNELTFGSNFLDIDHYYDPPAVPAHGERIFGAIVDATASHVAQAPERFRGVRLVDGFSNTIPWPAGSTEPPRVSALSKHPYPPRRNFPAQAQRGPNLDTQGRKTDFVPAYSCFFSEYAATAIQTETMARDVGDVPNNVQGTWHGRLTRHDAGHSPVFGPVPSPVDVWMTEMGVNPVELHIADPQAASRFKTTACLRNLFFFLGIGVQRVYIYAAFGKLAEFALADAQTAEPTPSLMAVRRIASQLGAYDGTLRRLEIFPLASTTDPVLFAGGPAADTPAMHLSDMLVLLPVQTAPDAISVIYYVMTLDMRVPLADHGVTVRLGTQAGEKMRVAAYDAVNHADLPATILQHTGGHMDIALRANDQPRLLKLGFGAQALP